MKQVRIWKVNVPYLLVCVLIPLALIVVTVRKYWRLPEGWDVTHLLHWPPELPFRWPPDAAAFIPLVVIVLCGLWLELGVRGIFRLCLGRLERDLDDKGFLRTCSFTGRNSAMILDEENGKIALLFKWNPIRPYIFSVRRIDKIWVEDGQRGRGVMQGTKRVSLLFTVGESRIRISTFSSNRRWRMDSDWVLTGISTADMLADTLEQVKGEEA